jgi:hypothetical protein
MRPLQTQDMQILGSIHIFPTSINNLKDNLIKKIATCKDNNEEFDEGGYMVGAQSKNW